MLLWVPWWQPLIMVLRISTRLSKALVGYWFADSCGCFGKSLGVRKVAVFANTWLERCVYRTSSMVVTRTQWHQKMLQRDSNNLAMTRVGKCGSLPFRHLEKQHHPTSCSPSPHTERFQPPYPPSSSPTTGLLDSSIPSYQHYPCHLLYQP